jgi:hypothetical protein
MNTQRLEEWIRQYNTIEKSIDECFVTYGEENSEQNTFSKETIKILEKRKEEILQIIIKEAKDGSFN